jgi:hypothetical protein
MRKIWKILIFLFLAGTIVYSQKVTVQVTTTVEQTSSGRINWEAGIIKATGMGVRPSGMPSAQAKALAKRAAIADCYRNLGEIINGVKVDSETVVKNFITESDEIRTQVSAFIKGAQIVSEKENPDGSYEVTMQLPLYGKESLGAIIIPEATKEEEQKLYPPAPETPLEEAYTGLIIDARGLNVKPCMSPKIISENGDEVYGTIRVSPEVVIEKGIVGYSSSIEKAKQSWRSGEKPLIVKATGKAGSFNADVLIKQSDAEKILRENEKSGFLQNLRVTIVI